MRGLEVMALSPSLGADPAIAIAACRAGARGIVDLEFASDASTARAAIERLGRFTSSPFGVKVGIAAGELIQILSESLPERLAWVLLAGGESDNTANWTKLLRSCGARVLFEAVTLAEARAAAKLDVDGIVLKGIESGGRIGVDTSFILLQRWLSEPDSTANSPEIWVQGGIGLNTAAACLAAGATGVVLDQQLLLARECQLGNIERGWLSACDGSETATIGESLGQNYRLANRPGSVTIERLQQEQSRLEAKGQSPAERRAAWQRVIHETAQQGAGSSPLLFLGQDVALARPLAQRYLTVGGIIAGIVDRAQQGVAAARRLRPLAEGAPLAESHGTQYPILQGPMTRVSDTAAFAGSVAEAGAMPFLALALLRKAETEKLLAETKTRLGDMPWGVGLLGFLPPEIRKEQVEAIRANKPPMALIAGGRPDQARELEKEGIPTYLHVPSPGLLTMFLRDGARRFIFEGRECGGHVGPRTSFVLWETMCEILLEHIAKGGKADELHVVFAGGIHDGLSGAMVSAIGAALAERGVKIGALIGTAYLFTSEAVAAGAIVSRFQQEAVSCEETVLLETGPGHAIRCIKTPYYDVFDAEKRRLQREGKSHEEIVKALEWMNIGRLRVASKGLDRATEGDTSKLINLPDDEQFNRGMYMIGQVATMHDRIITMAELHANVSNGATEQLEADRIEIVGQKPREKPCDVAVIGMACYYPKANSLREYWENILNKVYAVGEIPGTHWDWRLYYDANPRARDKICSKWGGFMSDVPFDPFTYGITPNSLPSIEPLQLLLLESVRHSLADAGYADRPFDRERVAAVLGIGGGGSPVAVAYGFRACLPLLDTVPGVPIKSSEILRFSEPMLPEWTEDSFPGFLLNVAVGRVSNRFNFGGPNYAVDAACGSSLAALQLCVRELEMGTSDVAVAMGADTVQTPLAYMAFSKTHALSQRGRCSPFDAAADGIVLSEGIGAVILKRLADAERDGDRIYAVIKGIGASSDGREKGLTAPNAGGQLRALRRAYGKSGISPADVGLIEAHGTGTVVGDHTEATSLGMVLREAGADPQSCALGSVKSMIGHTKCAAGIAGLIKTTLALHHKVLPPTLVETPNPKANFLDGPLYLNTEPRPWIQSGNKPRVAGVSAFGFGGTNFHVVLEEYTGNFLGDAPPAQQNWPVETLVWRRPTRAALIESVEQCLRSLSGKAKPRLRDLAASVWNSNRPDLSQPILAVVVTSLDDAQKKLAQALEDLRGTKQHVSDPRGIYFAERPTADRGKVAFLFPGQGSQYPNMLAALAMNFPEVRRQFDLADESLEGAFERPLSRYIFPPSTFTPEQEQTARQALAQTDVAQPAVGAASLGMFHLLSRLGVQPDYLAGHSYGEYAALCAAGAIRESDLIRLSHRRGRAIIDATTSESGGMAAVEAGAEALGELLKGIEGVTIANLNSPQQTVISGTQAGLDKAVALLKEKGLRAQRIPVACAFHSPLVAGAAQPWRDALAEFTLSSPQRPVFSNTTAAAHADDPEQIRAQLGEHLTSPVRFQAEIEALYAAGVRTFIEVGPQGVLTGLAQQTLGDRPYLAVASDSKSRHGLVQLAHVVSQLLAAGLLVDVGHLFEGRNLNAFDLPSLDQQTGEIKHSASTWIVNSVRSRPLKGEEPQLLGVSRAGAVLTPHTDAAAEPVVATSSHAPQPQPKPQPPAAPVQPAVRGTVPESVSMKPSSVVEYAVTPPAATNGAPVSHEPAPLVVGADEATHVMLGYQQLMSKFLDTQRTIMLSYLQGGVGAAPLAMPQSSPAYVDHQPHYSANGNGHAKPSENGNGHAPAGIMASLTNGAAHTNGHAEPMPQPSTNGEHAAAAAPVAEPAAAAMPAITREWLLAELTELVSKRTGYPKEMLDLDLDLEGDLGVDSIKRVEILGTLAESLGNMDSSQAGNLELEKLTGLKTLRGILDYLAVALSGGDGGNKTTTAGAAATAPTSGGGDAIAAEVAIQRGRAVLVDAPLPSGGSVLIPSGAIVLTDDGRGVARELAGRMADFGQRCVLVRMGTGGVTQDSDGAICANLTDPAAVDALVAHLRVECGVIAGFAHLLPLSGAIEGEDFVQRAAREVKSLYLLSRALEVDLRHAGEDGGAFLLAATSLGGTLGYGEGPLPETYFAGQGGILGFIKCLGMEWAEVLVRAVDLNVACPANELVDRLLAELGDPNGPLEIGYDGARRITWEPASAPTRSEQEATVVLEPGSTVLITGGARGITAPIALELARRYRPNLVLVGRSALPEESEASETAGLTAAAEIKAAIIARSQRQGRVAAPAVVESEYQRLLQDREIRANLATIRATGSQVIYHQADVRDEAAMKSLIASVEQKFGGIHGVIHAAGVIEDKLVKDKTPESFDRVFGTKVEGAVILSRHLKPENLKFFILFASIASRYGNRGQADYAAANEVLSKLAIQLDRQWPARVFAVAWGPWSGVGMVADLAPHLVKRGLKLISPEEGPQLLIDELVQGRKGESEVLVAGGAEKATRPPRSKPGAKPAPVGA